MHFCHEELFALLAVMPFMKIIASKLKAFYKQHFCCKHHKEET